MPLSAASAHDVVAIDAGIPDWQTLVAHLNPDTAVILLPAGGDGLAALAAALTDYGSIDTLHIISHGSQGQLHLGDLHLDAANLGQQDLALAHIASHLTPQSEVQLYGCSVAQGAAGQAFVNALSQALHGVDVGASSDPTGAAALGGNWNLEYWTGHAGGTMPFAEQDIVRYDAATFGDDALGPSQPGKPLLKASTDTGISSSDNITNAPTLTFTGTADPGDAINLYVNGVRLTAGMSSGSGTWSLNASSLAEGVYTVYVTADAPSGGTSVNSLPLTVTVDRTAPTTTVATASLSADTGVSTSDFVTRTAAQTISGTLSTALAAGEHVEISYNNGSSWTVLAATVGATTWTTIHTLSGNNTLLVRVADVAGNASSAYSHTYLVDTTAPTTRAATIALSADSGSSNGDFVTNVAAQTVSGTTDANLVAGEHVEVSLNHGVSWTTATSSVGSNAWSLAGVTLTASDTLEARVADLAGNASTAATQAYVYNTTAPTTTVATVGLSADTGSSGSDFITGTAAQTLSGTLSNNLAAGDHVEVSLDNGATWSTASAISGAAGWSLAATLAGSGTLQVRVVDSAGNAGAATTQAYVLDTTAPSAIALSAAHVTHAGAVSGAAVQALSATDANAVAYALAAGSAGNDADNASFTVVGNTLVAGHDLAAGTYHVYLSATDAAGNEADQALSFDVAAGPPSVTSILRAGAATVPAAAASLSYTVTFSEAVSGVDSGDFTLAASGNASGTITGVSTSDGGISYTVTVNAIGGDGTLRLDLNGSGTGILSVGSVAIGPGYSAGQTYTLDHTAPSAPSAPVMTTGTDTGASHSDAVTSNTTPVLTGGGEANATVTLYDSDGSTVLATTAADGSGNWSLGSAALAVGEHSLTVRQSDAAGNVSAASAALAVTVDTAAAALAAPLLSAGSDSGIADGITSVTTPAIHGTAEAYATVRLYDTDGSTLLGTSIADLSGAWSIVTSTLGNGSHSLSATQTDLAGNLSAAGTALLLTIDPNAPLTPPPPPPPAPPPSVDGVTVTRTAALLPGGGSGTATEVAEVGPDRIDSGGTAGAADIPLVTSDAGAGAATLLLAQLTTGFGLTSLGGPSQPAGVSLAALTAAIVAVVPESGAADQGHLTANAQSFIASLSAEVPLLLQNVAPRGNADAAAGGSLTLTGTSNAGQHTALVIDASGLAGGGRIVLQSVDFAAIVGAADVTALTPGQFLSGDGASQHFTVAASAGSAVLAGGGDDVLTLMAPASVATPSVHALAPLSAAPAPELGKVMLLDGGSGDDTVTLSGNRGDYTLQAHDGYLVLTANAQPQAQTLLVNVENLQFADAKVAVDNRVQLTSIAGLYQSVLGRQADWTGFAYWGASEQSGTSLGRIAVDIIGSTESQARQHSFNGDAGHDVELLYQTLFGRHSDTAGLVFWVDALKAGATLTQVADGFLHSAEMIGHNIAPVNWDFLVH